MNIQIKNYYFNLGNENDARDYHALYERLQLRGSVLFDCISTRGDGGHVPDGALELEEKHVFENQVNAGDFRVFDWFEAIVENRKIKRGHYIESGPGLDYLQELRARTHACGYCGAQYRGADVPTSGWCLACLGSEYLTEKELPLLALRPVSAGFMPGRVGAVPKWLRLHYATTQKAARLARLKKEKEDDENRALQAVEDARQEYEAKKWLVEHGFNFTNVIYYSHVKTFAFGWRNSITGDERAKLEKTLAAFPYKWEIK